MSVLEFGSSKSVFVVHNQLKAKSSRFYAKEMEARMTGLGTDETNSFAL